MIHEFDNVVLTDNMPEYHLQRGDIGTVVLVHPTGGFEVEFVTLDGQTLAVATLEPSQVRPVARGEIAHARAVEAA